MFPSVTADQLDDFKAWCRLTPDTLPQQLYVPPLGKPEVFLVDVDGTVALNTGRRFYDWHRVGEDLPNLPVIRVIRAVAAASGAEVIFMSGRKRICQWQTDVWLRTHVLPDYRDLIMRENNDGREDWITKRELFERYIREHFIVLGIFDDRDQVVKMWRSLGHTVFAVADGKF